MSPLLTLLLQVAVEKATLLVMLRQRAYESLLSVLLLRCPGQNKASGQLLMNIGHARRVMIRVDFYSQGYNSISTPCSAEKYPDVSWQSSPSTLCLVPRKHQHFSILRVPAFRTVPHTTDA
jgi:hypothetical protein